MRLTLGISGLFVVGLVLAGCPSEDSNAPAGGIDSGSTGTGVAAAEARRSPLRSQQPRVEPKQELPGPAEASLWPAPVARLPPRSRK